MYASYNIIKEKIEETYCIHLEKLYRSEITRLCKYLGTIYPPKSSTISQIIKTKDQILQYFDSIPDFSKVFDDPTLQEKVFRDIKAEEATHQIEYVEALAERDELTYHKKFAYMKTSSFQVIAQVMRNISKTNGPLYILPDNLNDFLHYLYSNSYFPAGTPPFQKVVGRPNEFYPLLDTIPDFETKFRGNSKWQMMVYNQVILNQIPSRKKKTRGKSKDEVIGTRIQNDVTIVPFQNDASKKADEPPPQGEENSSKTAQLPDDETKKTVLPQIYYDISENMFN